MKLYAFTAPVIGWDSFYILADTEEAAREAVKQHIERKWKERYQEDLRQHEEQKARSFFPERFKFQDTEEQAAFRAANEYARLFVVTCEPGQLLVVTTSE